MTVIVYSAEPNLAVRRGVYTQRSDSLGSSLKEAPRKHYLRRVKSHTMLESSVLMRMRNRIEI